ncbi:hypothetical protein HPP05_15020 [Corallococcus exiguus]|uniref:hypothetical protein n=1 Tax=Corallococcus TaxID=83461 RepID=UPI000EF6CA4A|nr:MULTISPECIES: hypothetical protein [Corallococcus]NPC71061.1 hypothetical protein [Corallococcus exiguus]
MGESDEALFATVRYDPAPNSRVIEGAHAAPGQLRFEGDEDDSWQDVDVREQQTIEVLRRLRDANGPRAAELRKQIRSLGVGTLPRLGGPFDVRWLTGLTELERVGVYSHTGIVGASALSELPALRHASLFAFMKNSIRDLDGISRSRSLESLQLSFGGLGDLRALSGLETLRKLVVYESEPLSIRGLEDLPIEELELWLWKNNDLSALPALRSLRSLSLREQISVTEAKVIARCRIPILRLPLLGSTPDLEPISALPDTEELELVAWSLDATSTRAGRLPMTSLKLQFLDEEGLRHLAHAPRLRTLRIRALAATNLDAIADLPELRGLRFDITRKLRSLDRVPSAAFLDDPRVPDGPNRLVLKGAPLTSIRQLGNLRGVEHLDLRNCTELTSLRGLEGMNALRSIDLRECPGLVDMTSLEALPALRAVLVNHRGPTGPVPSSIRPRVVRANLRGFVRRLHRGEVEAPDT